MQYTKHCVVWLLVLALVFALALTGCGKNSEEENAVAAAEAGETPISDAAEEAASEETADTVEIKNDSTEAIVSVTLIANENDDGTQSVAGAAIEYGSNIDASSLSASDYLVMSGSTEYYVADIYTNSEAAFAEASTEGCFVILVLTENSMGAMEETPEEVEGPVSGAEVIEAEGEGPAAEEDPEVTPYAVGGEEESVPEGPEGWDSDAEVILGSSPMEEASGEVETEVAEATEDTLSITVTQIDTVCTADQTEIGPSPAIYESTVVVVA